MTLTALNNIQIRITRQFRYLCEIGLHGIPWDPKEGFDEKNRDQRFSRYCTFKGRLPTAIALLNVALKIVVALLN